MDSWQCSPSPCQCFPSPSPGVPLHIPLVWVVRALMLGSMQLQLFLVFCGARRYRNSNSLLRFVVWGAYLAADVVAISALGIMTHSIRKRIYGLWAPILLIHLGGPDTISAYSTADNELWTRHLFIMIYQVLIAAYVIYISRLEGRLLAASVLLFLAGATKYAERTLALRSASNTQMVNSTNGLYKFMQFEGKYDPNDYNYVVQGEKRLRKMERHLTTDDSKMLDAVRKENAIVTIQKVSDQEGGVMTPDKYNLCLSHALFKMYKRRFVGLSFHEGALPKTRNFFINNPRLDCEQLFSVIERELKFVYDVLFSKSGSTAFQKEGIVLRLLNVCLLAVAAYLVFFQLSKKPAHKTVTFVIISVALSVELIQLCRIALSDWTMVYLVCAHIKNMNRPRFYGWSRIRIIKLSMSVLDIARKLVKKKCWENKINQYSLIWAPEKSMRCGRHQCFRFMLKRAQSSWMPRSVLQFYISLFHIEKVDVKIQLKSFIFDIIKDKCSHDNDILICRDRVYDPDEYLTRKNCIELKEEAEVQLEESILQWHIATSICEFDSDSSQHPEKFGIASTLSRYFAYLLVERPNILPLHADIAVFSYIEIQREIAAMSRYVSSRPKDDKNGNQIINRSISLADKLNKRADKWDIIADHWGELLIYVAAYNKAPLHAECIASGGEFLSQVWALLGHLGCGEQSDTAVTKRKDTKIDEEYLTQKRKEDEQRYNRAMDMKKRQEKNKMRTSREIDEERTEHDQKMKNEAEKRRKVEEKLKSIIEDPSRSKPHEISTNKLQKELVE